MNQTRSRRQSSGDDSETSAGGAPLKLYASVRVVLDPQAGDRVGFRILKNKGAGAFREGRLKRRQSGEFTESP